MKHILYLIVINFLILNLKAQDGAIYETYRQPNWQGDSNAATIFPQPFQEYNYIKSHRGIEVYRTYKHTNVFTTSTNKYFKSGDTIFSRSEPEYIIRNDGNVYKTYSYGTNRNSIFTKPFQSLTIKNNDKTKLSFDGETLSGGE